MNNKLYVVLAGRYYEDDSYPHSIHKSRVSAENTVTMLKQPDEDGYEDVYAYITEVDFYDQDA